MSTDKTNDEKVLSSTSVASGSSSKGVQVALGFVLGFVINFVVISGTSFLLSGDFFYASVGPILFYAFVFFGATQLIWQLPLILLLRKRHSSVALGILLAAVATALFCTFFGRMEFRPNESNCIFQFYITKPNAC